MRQFGWTPEYIRTLRPAEFQHWSKMADRLHGIEMLYLMQVINYPWISEENDRRQIMETLQAKAGGREPVEMRLTVDDLKATLGVPNG